MKKIILVVVLLTMTFGFAQDTQSFFTNANTFFKTYVKGGKVDYKSIQKDPAALNALLTLMSKASVRKSDTKTYQAFYINAYNLAVIKGVVNHYPIKNPLAVKGFFNKITYTIAGQKITLNTLENKKLRANFPDEARFHFALVCAGLGCPPIIAEAYTPSTLEKQLQRQAVKALNNPKFIKVKGNKVQLSQIFEWYKEDFTRHGSEIEYINTFRKEALPVQAKVSYYTYDWTLNKL